MESAPGYASGATAASKPGGLPRQGSRRLRLMKITGSGCQEGIMRCGFASGPPGRSEMDR